MGIGIKVIEVDAADTPAVQQATLGQSLLAFQAPRGVPGKPRLLDSEQTIRSLHCPAGFSKNFMGPLVARSVLWNAGEGGAVVFGARVVSSTNPPTASEYTAQQGGSVDVWKFTAGYFGEEDPGAWSDNKVGIQILAGTTDATTMRDVVVYYRPTTTSAWVEQNRFQDVIAGSEGGSIVVINKSGTGSTHVMVEVLDETVLPDVMGAPQALVGGVDASTPTPAIVEATSAGPFAVEDGETLQVTTDAEDETLTLAFTKASVVSGSNEPYTFASDMILQVEAGGVKSQATVPSGSTTKEEVALALNGLIGCRALVEGSGVKLESDKGGTGQYVIVEGGTANAVLNFPTSNNVGTGDAADNTAMTVSEVHTWLQSNVNLNGEVEAVTVSSKMQIRTIGTGAARTIQIGGTARTKFLLDADLHTGTDAGTSEPSDSDYRDVLAAAARAQDVQIIAAGDRYSASWGIALESLAAELGNMIGILCAEDNLSDSDLATNYAALLKAKSFLAGYRGWIEVGLPDGTSAYIPNTGHVIGAGYVRKMRAKGGLPHVAPAGVQTSSSDAMAVRDPYYDNNRMTAVTTGAGFNPVVFERGFGFYIPTSRTFSTETKWYSAHVRVLINFIKTSVRRSYAPLLQDSNNEDTRGRLRRSLTTFMSGLYKKGSFDTSGGFDNNVAVICDATNNPQSVVRARKMKASLVFRPVEIIEELEISIVNTSNGLIIDEE